jgi:hypothetical protein
VSLTRLERYVSSAGLARRPDSRGCPQTLVMLWRGLRPRWDDGWRWLEAGMSGWGDAGLG